MTRVLMRVIYRMVITWLMQACLLLLRCMRTQVNHAQCVLLSDYCRNWGKKPIVERPSCTSYYLCNQLLAYGESRTAVRMSSYGPITTNAAPAPHSDCEPARSAPATCSGTRGRGTSPRRSHPLRCGPVPRQGRESRKHTGRASARFATVAPPRILCRRPRINMGQYLT